jgi:hypothetical protein
VRIHSLSSADIFTDGGPYAFCVYDTNGIFATCEDVLGVLQHLSQRLVLQPPLKHSERTDGVIVRYLLISQAASFWSSNPFAANLLLSSHRIISPLL